MCCRMEKEKGDLMEKCENCPINKIIDLIGKIVGVSRIVPEGLVKNYFGFSGVANALTFSQAPMFDFLNDPLYSSTQLNDNQFRFFIRSKIAKNITSAYMVNDDRQSLQQTIQYLFKNQAFVVDNKNMTLTIYVSQAFPEEDLVLLQALDLIPSPQGVGIYLVVSYDIDGTFGFAQNPNAKGFGDGKFASLII